MKYQQDSFKGHIDSLIQEATRLSGYLVLNEYFKAVEEIQNSYMVEVRRIYAVKLLKEGLSNSDIARLMCKDHATISYLVRTTNENDPVRKEILPHCERWITEGLYPETYTEWVTSAEHKHGLKSVVNYKLKSIYNGECKSNNRQNDSADSRIEKVA